MSEPVVILVDNGSVRAAAVRSLRGIAARLSAATGCDVHAVSVQHADRIAPDELDGEAAEVLPTFLRRQLDDGRRAFAIVPLFFGDSRATTVAIPAQIARLRDEYGGFEVRQAAVLSPRPDGEPRIADILADHVAGCERTLGARPETVVVVDHGSPLPEVTAVRERAVLDLRARLPDGIELAQAAMERRPGAAYDFNGELLGDLLDRRAAREPSARIALAMLFISPGRHAGPGGDIESICRDAMARHPGLRVAVSPLVGEHPLLTDILKARLNAIL